jgi:hypothetical protein
MAKEHPELLATVKLSDIITKQKSREKPWELCCINYQEHCCFLFPKNVQFPTKDAQYGTQLPLF